MKYRDSLFKPMNRNSVDNQKRRSLKIIGGSAAVAGTMASSLMIPGVTAAAPTSAIENSTGRNTGHNTGLVAISIMICKSVTYDWILMENLSEQPIEVTKFNPGVIGYLGKQLDLNQLLLASATNGSLLLHNDYAWSESLYKVPASPVRASSYHQLQTDSIIESISADTRVVKVWANVVESSAEVFIGDPSEAFA